MKNLDFGLVKYTYPLEGLKIFFIANVFFFLVRWFIQMKTILSYKIVYGIL
jgi:hypothetical protein